MISARNLNPGQCFATSAVCSREALKFVEAPASNRIDAVGKPENVRGLCGAKRGRWRRLFQTGRLFVKSSRTSKVGGSTSQTECLCHRQVNLATTVNESHAAK